MISSVRISYLKTTQPGSKGQLPTSVLTLVPARSHSLFDWLFDNKRLSNFSKELLLVFRETLIKIAAMGKRDIGLKNGLIVYLKVMYVPKLAQFEPYPSAHVGEISYVCSFWGPFLLIPIQKWSYFKWLLSNICFMCRACEELKRSNGSWRFRILGFQERLGHYDIINGGQGKK